MGETTYIYGLIDPASRAIRYIGKSIQPQERLKQHIRDVRAGRLHNRHLQSWIRGLLSADLEPELMVLDCVPATGWQRYEIAWIALLRKSGTGLVNLDDGGQGATAGRPKSPAHRKAIGEAQRGKVISEEHKERLRIFHTGRKASAETLKKMSLARTGAGNPNFGRPRTAETREKVRIGVIRAFEEGRLKKLIGPDNPMFGRPAPNRGKPRSERTREAMRIGYIIFRMRRELYVGPNPMGRRIVLKGR